jgi:hypothetical protein
MRWTSGRRSENVEDRRGFRLSRRAAGGGIGTIVLVLVALYLGVDPSVILDQTQMTVPGVGTPTTQSAPYSASPEEKRLAEFVSVVLADTEDTWHSLFRGMEKTYEEPKLVLFSGSVESACGFASRIKRYISTSASTATSRTGSAHRGISRRPTSSHTRWGIMSRTCWELPKRSIRFATGSARQRPTSFLSWWNCRRIAFPACGPTMPTRPETSSIKATSRKPSMRQALSAMTGSSDSPGDT